MKRNIIAAFICAASFVAAADEALPPKPASEAEQQAENRTATEILSDCSKIIPTEKLLLTGTLKVRKLRGIVLTESPFKLMMDWGSTPPNAEILLMDPQGTSLVERAVMTRPAGKPADIKLFRGPEQKPEEAPSYAGLVAGTDMTWLDLSLDFLWWKDVRFDDTPRGDSRNGRDCDILVAVPPKPIPGCSAMRVWIDRQLKCIMQAEQLGPQGNPVRRMWVQRVKKMDDRWMVRDMEVETSNSGHRTQLFVDDVTEP